MASNKKNQKKVPKWNAKKTEVIKEKELDFFLMLEKEATANDVIVALKERNLTGLDVWEAMGVFNIEAKAGDEVDFEEISIQETFVNTSDLAYIKNRNIHTIFAFRATESQFELLKPYLKEMTEIFGGFACSDSDDFLPIIEL